MKFSIKDLTKLTNEVCMIVKSASLILNKETVIAYDSYNPSTNIDIEISDFLTISLTQLVNLPVISEENTPKENLHQKGFSWVIDPLDGTLNVLTKNTPYCISVSLVDLDSLEALLSCNYIPYDKEMYYAIKGQGAFLNEYKITNQNYSNRIISYGLPNDTIENIDFHLNHIKAVLETGFITRQRGSASYDILMAASGKYYAFYEFGLFLWDFIGADLFAKECGCKSIYRQSNKRKNNSFQYDYIVSGNLNNLNNIKKILNYD
jgi:Archaeal fructose-1,6-bisphosphatase and related enzymes of inositol monophosphatase family